MNVLPAIAVLCWSEVPITRVARQRLHGEVTRDPCTRLEQPFSFCPGFHLTHKEHLLDVRHAGLAGTWPVPRDPDRKEPSWTSQHSADFTHYYGQNCSSRSNTYVEALTPQRDSIWSLWEVIRVKWGHEGVALTLALLLL